ncbi:hypothetical protein CLIB1423_17S01530 [[Candida] railenensis]|uniref:RRM domain-containing protein n=1 Tax=[Candida] railenensis TaxID=45579 RepID=A0A9P0W0G6_9ASCO|nr:hypothetical protein CLIB1423_17S01530 [[Candida] railenensis]
MEVNPVSLAKKSEDSGTDGVDSSDLQAPQANGPAQSETVDEELEGVVSQKAENVDKIDREIGTAQKKGNEDENKHEDEEEEEEEEEEEMYDPETSYRDESPAVDSGQATRKTESKSDDSDYDPEEFAPVVNKPPTATVHKPAAAPAPAPAIRSSGIPGLPPRPPVRAVRIGHSKTVPTGGLAPSSAPARQMTLNEAMEAIMTSDVVKDPNFIKLSQVEQMKIIQEQLAKQGVHLPDQKPPSNSTDYKNYDQVYSYNKPFKHIKDRIPLVPVNEFCRRPNITIPMTPQEEKDYEAFVQTELRYNSANNWDEFPDKSRLFVGNLPANTITKQDLYRIFSQYGEVIQIVIKAGFGFVQFRTTEACLECIKGETDVPLHNKIMRLDASRPQKSGSSSSPILSRGRERTTSEEVDDDQSNKRTKLDDKTYQITKESTVDAQDTGKEADFDGDDDEGEEDDDEDSEPECYIYITSDSQSTVVKKCNEVFSKSEIVFEFEDVSDQDITEVISDAAYTGIIGACVIKESKVDLQTFESTPDGGIKFDEYEGIEPEVAVEILAKYKSKKKASSTGPRKEVPSISNQAPSTIPKVPAPSLPAIPKKLNAPVIINNGNPNGNNNAYENQYSRGRNQRVKNQRVGQHAPPTVPVNSYGSFNYANNEPFPQTLPAVPQAHHHQQIPTQAFPYQPSPTRSQHLVQSQGYQNQVPPGQSFTAQPGFGVPTYGAPPPPPANHNPYGVPFGQHQPATLPQQQQQQVASDPNAQLMKTLQNMDPSAMQNMISLLQQQQQQQQINTPQHHPQQQQQFQYQKQFPQNANYGSASQNPSGFSSPNPNYAPDPPQTQTQPPKSQLDSLLSQLQSNQPPNFQNSQSQTESLLDTLQRLNGQR